MLSAASAGTALAGTFVAFTALAGFAGYAQPAIAQNPPAARALPIDQAALTHASPPPANLAATKPVALTGSPPTNLAVTRPVAVARPPTEQTATAVPAVEDCGMGKSEVRPKSLILTCADANDLGKDLVWSKWGPTSADATGIDTWNECEPYYCAASKTWYTTSANFTLSKPVHTAKGWLFERLTVHITGQTPRKVEKLITFSEAPVSGP